MSADIFDGSRLCRSSAEAVNDILSGGKCHFGASVADGTFEGHPFTFLSCFTTTTLQPLTCDRTSTMTGAGGPSKRYNLRSRRRDAATDAEHLQTTAPAAVTAVTTVTANENQRDNADDTTEADSAHVGCDNDPALTSEADIKPLRKLANISHAETGTEYLQKTAPAATNSNHLGNSGGATEANSTSIVKSKHIQRNRRNIFRFTDLPAEIRNEIYNLSLKTGLPIALRVFKSYTNGEHGVMQTLYSGSRETGLTPNLLLLNKATYVEAGAILYGNHFCFHSPKALFVFLSSLSPTPKAWLHELTFSYWTGPPVMSFDPNHDRDVIERAFLLPAFTALNGAANLKNLHLEFSIETIKKQQWTPRRTAMILYSFMHFWLHALSKEKSSISRAVELIDIKIVDLTYDSFRTRYDLCSLWRCPGYAKHADKSVLRTSMLREHLMQFMDGRLTWRMVSELEPVRP